MNPHLRSATPTDRGRIQALLAECGLPLPGDYPDAVYLVVEEGGRLLGVAGLERYEGDGLLRSVAVAPSARGSGVGAGLTRAILDEARRGGLRAVYALTTTAEGYFPRLGFEVIGRSEVPQAVQESEEFSAVCPSTATVLRLLL